MKKGLALFDFDGTITRKDTFLEFIKFYSGSFKFYVGLAVLTPILALYKFKFIPNWRAKEIVFGYFFKGISVSKFKQLGKDFVATKLPSLLKPSALKKLKEHIQDGDRVIIVTASAEEWIKPWTDTLGIELITTKWDQEDGKITGKICGINCYGPEKKKRIEALLKPIDYSDIHVYGDTSGDKDMFTLGSKTYYRLFND